MANKINERVAKRLRVHAANGGHSIATLGTAIGRPKSSAAHLLNGDHPIRIGDLIGLSRAMGLPVIEVVPWLAAVPPNDRAMVELVEDVPVETLVALAALCGMAPSDIVRDFEVA